MKMAEDKKKVEVKKRTSELKGLLLQLDKLKTTIDKGSVAEKPQKKEEKPKPDKKVREELVRRKAEIRQLLNVLDEEYRESVISEKTYQEAKKRSKEELIKIQEQLEDIESGGSGDVKVSKIVELEKQRVEFQNKMKDLTESFARAEITQEKYMKELSIVKQDLDKVKAEIMRLDKGATVPEVRQEEKPKEKKKEEKPKEDKVVIHSKLQPESEEDEK